VPRTEGQDKTAVRTAWLPQFFDHTCDPVRVRTAYRCRAYPDPAQQQMLNRTFGCVRVVWNRTLAARQARWHTERRSTSYAETDRALTAMKKDPGLAFLSARPISSRSRTSTSATWSATGIWPAPSPAAAGASSAASLPTSASGTAAAWSSSTAGTPRPRPARRAGTGSRSWPCPRGTGRARPAAPGTTGTSTPPRTSLRQVVP
jgi:Helix-turn-helix domain